MAIANPLKLAVIVSSITVMAGCVHKDAIPEFEVHHPNPSSQPSAILHPASTATISVPNADHRSMKAEVISVNGGRITPAHPVVLPAGVHVFKLRCTLSSTDYRARGDRVFHGQTQWRLNATKTYTLRPRFNVDDYGEPVCSASLHENL